MINCQWTDEELDQHLNAADKKYIADNNIQLYTINAIDKAIEIGMGKRTTPSCSPAFFKLADIMPIDEAVDYMKQAAKKSYGKKGDAVVEMNYKAIDAGVDAVHKVEVPESWHNPAPDAPAKELAGRPELVKMVRDVMEPVARMDGDSLPVSAFAHNPNGELGAGRLRLREARHRRHGPRVEPRQVHPVQPVCVRLLSRHHPSLLPDRRPRSLPPLPRPSSLPTSSRSPASTSSPWLSARWTAWAAASASPSAPPRPSR